MVRCNGPFSGNQTRFFDLDLNATVDKKPLESTRGLKVMIFKTKFGRSERISSLPEALDL